MTAKLVRLLGLAAVLVGVYGLTGWPGVVILAGAALYVAADEWKK